MVLDRVDYADLVMVPKMSRPWDDSEKKWTEMVHWLRSCAT